MAIMAIGLFACDSDSKVRDLGVTSVKSLYEPINGRTLELQPSASAMLYFEWEPARSEDGGMVQYEIAFDKEDGDFSNPLTIIASNNKGASNHATITHKELNKIAAATGLDSGEKGTIKWTVLSSKGINPVKAEQANTLTVTRLDGFADIPEDLFITGSATEVGDDLSKAIKMKKISDGEFEIYTKLTKGESFKFVSSNSGEPKEYSLKGEQLVVGGESSVEETGIYKYYIDFTIGSYKTKEVTKVNLFINGAQVKIELPYKGLGVWELINHSITGVSDNDDRYKFRMESSEGETEWRAPSNDSKPSGNAEYYYMVEKDNVQQWTNGEIWKSPSTDGWNGKTYDFSFSLNPGGPYTHNLTIK